METKTVRLRGKRWKLPLVLRDHQSWGKAHFYRVIDFRPPRKGEMYLSGAIVGWYKAPSDLSDSFLVVEFTERAKISERWVLA